MTKEIKTMPFSEEVLIQISLLKVIKLISIHQMLSNQHNSYKEVEADQDRSHKLNLINQVFRARVSSKSSKKFKTVVEMKLRESHKLCLIRRIKRRLMDSSLTMNKSIKDWKIK